VEVPEWQSLVRSPREVGIEDGKDAQRGQDRQRDRREEVRHEGDEDRRKRVRDGGEPEVPDEVGLQRHRQGHSEDVPEEDPAQNEEIVRDVGVEGGHS